METLLPYMLSYLIGVAVNMSTGAIAQKREAALKKELEDTEKLKKAIKSSTSLRSELSIACAELSSNRAYIGVTSQEAPLWELLNDETFQADLAEWFIAGGIKEGKIVKERLLKRILLALSNIDLTPAQAEFLKTSYFDTIEKTLFSNPTLAHWRHQLSLDYLREQVSIVRNFAEKAAGIYSAEEQKKALDKYCEKALSAWDIIDLSKLPEGDIHMATQKLLLRKLYMPLRIHFEPTQPNEDNDAALARLEAQRRSRRHKEAGHIIEDRIINPNSTPESRLPVGERLSTSSRLVILGDPGAGKTTMLRWIATSYLLQYKNEEIFKQIPDTKTLPSKPWIPVLIRCRDLGDAELCRSFTEFLSQHLQKSELLPEEAKIMQTIILDYMAKGEVLLLIDGLDEITDPRIRMTFCQQLEQTAARYPNAPIVVTSRIVGYRDMPYRMGASFEHGQIAELNADDKDLFANRWIAVTEQHKSKSEQAKRAQELLEALHSSDRIERLTGNPMLLTTLALVKRKVGKLPNKRTKLYAEAVSVLLNWNPRLYEAIEEDEAIPQLEYLAYEMCRQGVQRLPDDEVLDLLDAIRASYPNIRDVKNRNPKEFLKQLEARSSILIKSGNIWQNNNQEKPVWEFRHLTFQEYLAARAIQDGRYPNRNKSKSLAQQVAPLAGIVTTHKSSRFKMSEEDETEVPESWREVLRLLVSDCKDDDVDEVLLAILNPLDGEDSTKTTRPRIILAAQCLADEPNVSNEIAERVISCFVEAISANDGSGYVHTSFDRTAMEIGRSIWMPSLKKALIHQICMRPSSKIWGIGGLWGMIEVNNWKRSGVDPHNFFTELVARFNFEDKREVISATLTIMQAAYEGKIEMIENLPSNLLNVLESTYPPLVESAAWAMGWLSIGSVDRNKDYWRPKDNEVKRIAKVLETVDKNEDFTIRWLALVLGYSSDSSVLPVLIKCFDNSNTQVLTTIIDAFVRIGDTQAVQPLLAKLNVPDAEICKAAINALGRLGDTQAVQPLLAKLSDQDAEICKAAINALGQLGDTQVVQPLLAKLNDQDAKICKTAINALGQLGDTQAVVPLLGKLDIKDLAIRIHVINALGKLNDKSAIEPLLQIKEHNHKTRVAVAGALAMLGDDRGQKMLFEFLHHRSPERRTSAVATLMKIRNNPKEQILLSCFLTGTDPWIDPIEPITQKRITDTAQVLGVTLKEAHSLYDSLAADFRLNIPDTQ